MAKSYAEHMDETAAKLQAGGIVHPTLGANLTTSAEWWEAGRKSFEVYRRNSISRLRIAFAIMDAGAFGSARISSSTWTTGIMSGSTRPCAC